MPDTTPCSLEEGLAVLKLLLDRGAPANTQMIAAELGLAQIKAIRAVTELRGTGFVQQVPGTDKYTVAKDVEDGLGRASRRDLLLPPRPRGLAPMDVAVMDTVGKRRYADEAEAALFAACEEQGRVVLPSARALAIHFGLSTEWAASALTLLIEKADVVATEHASCGTRSACRAVLPCTAGRVPPGPDRPGTAHPSRRP